jgi:hypothetical protein
MAKRASSPEIAERLIALKHLGFQFEDVDENLRKAGAGQKTRQS